MTTPSLPTLVDTLSSLGLLTLAVFMVAAHTALLTAASARTERRRPLVPLLAAAFLAAWLGLGIATADALRFPIARGDLRLPVSAAVGFGPAVIAAAILFSVRAVRALNDATPPAWLIWIQSYRIGGFIFLYPFLYYGLVPAAFALPAALGDMLTGILAPFVGRAVARRDRRALAWAVAWNVFGIVDLLVAPASAVLSGARVVAYYPLALVPLFLGPPLGLLTHVFSLRSLARARRAQLAATQAPASVASPRAGLAGTGA